jgi:hypothetical protein
MIIQDMKQYLKEWHLRHKERFYDFCNCGNKKAKISNQCRDCHFKDRIGYKHTKETKNKIGIGNKGKLVLKETGEKISKTKKASSTTPRGKEHYMFGKVIHGKWEKYKGIWMRSSWEVAYAKYLDKNNIKWLYESKVFDLKITGYIPDFYLSKSNTYIEIKGWWRDDAKKKFRLFKKIYPKVKIIVLTKSKLKKLGILK